MKPGTPLLGVLLFSVGAAAGLVASPIVTGAGQTPADAISMSWESQLDALVGPDGSVREPEQSRELTKLAFKGSTMGLALHFHPLSAQERSALSGKIAQAASLDLSPDGDESTRSVLACIQSAGTDRRVDENCVADAVRGK